MLKRTTIIILLFTAFMPAFLQAQISRLQNQPKYDNRTVHFGFCLGINFFDFQIRQKADLAANPNLFSLYSDPSPGYSIGIISNLRLAEFLDLRFIPTFAATVRRLYVDMIDPYTLERGIKEFEVESSFIQFPFELKYKSERINNHRWYVLGAIQYSIDLASQEKVEDDTIFKIKRNSTDAQIGVGVDIYFEYFKFSPQIKASFGLNSLLVEDGTVPVSGIDQLMNRCLLINFTFE